MTQELKNNYSPKEIKWQIWAAKAFFFIGGFGAATWAPLVPLLRERLQLTDDILGMLLLCVGIGSLLTMPISGSAAAKWGCRRVLMATAVGYAVVLLVLSQVQSLPFLIPMILCLGAMMGAIDVVVNVLAVMVERNAKKRVMSGMHAFWSIGGFVGAGIFSIWLNVGLNHFQSVVIAALIIMVLMCIFFRHLLASGGEKHEGSMLVMPKGIVVFIGLAAFISFLQEGAMMDWGGVLLVTLKGMDMSMAGIGFTIFSAAMLLMRLSGDWIVNKLGGKLVTFGGALLACVGILLLVFAPYNWLLYAGFFLVGIGSANIVPVFFSMMGRQKEMPINQAVSAVSTLGYLGILAGPAVIGFVANISSLYVSFLLLAVLLLLQAILSRYVYSKVL